MAKRSAISGRSRTRGGPAARAKAVGDQTLAMFARGATLTGDLPLGGPSDPYRESLWTYKCIRVKATAAAGVPLRLSRGMAAGTRAVGAYKAVRCGPYAGRIAARDLKAAEGEIVSSGPLADLLSRPNEGQIWSEFFEQTVGALQLCGRVHWLFDVMQGLRPVSMYVVPGSLSRPLAVKTRLGDRLGGWEFTGSDGVPYKVALIECITFQQVHPLRPLDAVSASSPSALAVISDYNASKYNAAMFGNSAEPGGVLKTSAPFDRGLDEQIRSAWSERHRGAARAKSVAVLWGGLDWQSIASTMADMQFDAGKRLTRTEVCAAWDVPEVVAGFYTDANYGFAETGHEQFWWATMMPLLAKFGEGINVHLARRFDGNLEAWFDLEDNPVIQRMRLKRLEAVDKLWPKGVPLADLIDRFDLALPQRPWHAIGFLPSGVLPAQDVAAGGGFDTTPEGPSPGPPTDDMGQETAANPQSSIRSPQLEAAEAVERAAKDRIWQAWARACAPLASQFRTVLRAHWFGQERRLTAALQNAELGARSAEQTKAPDPESVLIQVFADAGARRVFQARVRQALLDGHELGLRQALTESGLAGDALDQALKRLLSDPRLRDVVAGEAVKISGQIDRATQAKVRAQLAEGIAAGEDPRKLADRIEAYFGHRRGQAMLVSRNVVGQALSQARFNGQRDAGMTHKLWIHARNASAHRPTHVAAEVRYAKTPCPIHSKFEVGAALLMYPRDASAGHPEETVNCQCLSVARRLASGERASAGAILKAFEGTAFVTYGEMLAGRNAERGARNAEREKEQQQHT